jgi:soluble lytic murein transglycosylase-like protein
MNRMTTAALALGMGLSSFAAIAVARDLPTGVRCYLAGCYDEEGNRVDDVTTASVALQGGSAIEAAKKGEGIDHSDIDEIIEKHARAYGVPLSIAKAVVRIESNYRPNARGSAGEVGLMQIKPATARMMGYKGSVKGLFDPETNIKFGMKYLGMAQERGDGSICNTILKYNAGHAAKRMNPVSRAYCAKVKRSIDG